MTNKKRELIEILLDNVKPEDWPEDAKYAAQDKYSAAHGKNKVMFYVYAEPKIIDREPYTYFNGQVLDDPIQLPELCAHWNKTIVHRDEFMKRWNERNRTYEITVTNWPKSVDAPKTYPVEFTEIGGVKEDPVTYKSTKLKSPLVQIVDSEGWIQWNGGEMPVEKGTLIDVKYRDGSMTSEVFNTCDNEFRYSRNWCRLYSEKDIIAYRIHEPQEQKTPQQLALEKFGTDWHDNEGVKPVDDEVLIDAVVHSGALMRKYTWPTLGLFKIKKWRIHSDDKDSRIHEKETALESLRKPIPECSAEIPCHFVDVKGGPMRGDPAVKSPLSTQIGGDHYTKLAIQPMQYSMKNRLDSLQHTIIKYVTRFRDKAGIEDLEKAKHCIDMLIEFERESK